MDSSTIAVIASIIVAILAIVPGTIALVNQNKKDTNEAKLNMTTAAQNAAMAMILPLQTEIARLQARIADLEQQLAKQEELLTEKTTLIGQMQQEGIDKDTAMRKLQYNMEGLQMKLDAVLPTTPAQKKARAKVDTEVEEATATKIKEDEADSIVKKHAIDVDMKTSLEKIKGQSIDKTGE